MRRVAAAGHELGCHSWSHGRDLDRRPLRACAELRRSAAAVAGAGVPRPRLFRPPYGRSSAALVRAAALAGMRTVAWDVDPRDWQTDDPGLVAERVIADARAGSIVLLHESARGEAAIDAVGEIVDGLHARGLRPVTVSALLDD